MNITHLTTHIESPRTLALKNRMYDSQSMMSYITLKLHLQLQ